jgi:hypothetical protein
MAGQAGGFVCAVKRARVIGAKDQRTTSGPADSILRVKDPMIEAQGE